MWSPPLALTANLEPRENGGEGQVGCGCLSRGGGGSSQLCSSRGKNLWTDESEGAEAAEGTILEILETKDGQKVPVADPSALSHGCDMGPG